MLKHSDLSQIDTNSSKNLKVISYILYSISLKSKNELLKNVQMLVSFSLQYLYLGVGIAANITKHWMPPLP